MKPSTALLVLPPPSYILSSPQGSLPALTAALRVNGYEVIQRDLAVETLYFLLDDSCAHSLFASADTLFSDLEARNDPEIETYRICRNKVRDLLPGLNSMKQAGAYYYYLNPETLNQKTADLHNKGYDVRHIRSLIRYWEDNSDRLPPLTLNFFTAFPGEKLEDFQETFDIIRRGKFFVQSIHPWYFAKNSDVHNHPHQYGIRIAHRQTPAGVFDNYTFEFDDDVLKEINRIQKYLAENIQALSERFLPQHTLAGLARG